MVDDGLLVVTTDTDGRVLWRHGNTGVRRLADRLGFVPGSAWTEANVGTNAIGTCLVVGEPVHIEGPEHYVESHTRWSCAAAPVLDPWTGETLGAVDISGPAFAVQRSVLALVGVTAKLAEAEVRNEHAMALERLRAYAAPVVAQGGRSHAGRRSQRAHRGRHRLHRARPPDAAGRPVRGVDLAAGPRRRHGGTAPRRLAGAPRRRRARRHRPGARPARAAAASCA